MGLGLLLHRRLGHVLPSVVTWKDRLGALVGARGQSDPGPAR